MFKHSKILWRDCFLDSLSNSCSAYLWAKQKLFGNDHQVNVSGSELQIIVTHAMTLIYCVIVVHHSENANRDELRWILLMF